MNTPTKTLSELQWEREERLDRGKSTPFRLISQLEWLERNREAIAEQQRPEIMARRRKRAAYMRRLLAGHPSYALADRHRALVRYALVSRDRHVRNQDRLRPMIGCTIDELREHIEDQLAPGMTWENKGEWEIDHIRPCCSFDLLDPDQMAECFHFTNLRPVWKRENQEKAVEDMKLSVWKSPQP